MAHCLFCDETKLTNEHIWGDWTLKYSGILNSINNRSRHTVADYAMKADFTVKTDPIIRSGIFDRKNATPLHSKRKIVCEKCNNGWMSRLENETARIFRSKFRNSSQPSIAQLLTLARWAVLKSMTQAYSVISAAHNCGPADVFKKDTLLQMRDGEFPDEFTAALFTMDNPGIWGFHNIKFARYLNDNTTAVWYAGAAGPLGFLVTSRFRDQPYMEHLAVENALTMCLIKSDTRDKVSLPLVAISYAELEAILLEVIPMKEARTLYLN